MGYCITCMCIVQTVCLSVSLRALVLDLAIMLGAVCYLYEIFPKTLVGLFLLLRKAIAALLWTQGNACRIGEHVMFFHFIIPIYPTQELATKLRSAGSLSCFIGTKSHLFKQLSCFTDT